MKLMMNIMIAFSLVITNGFFSSAVVAEDSSDDYYYETEMRQPAEEEMDYRVSHDGAIARMSSVTGDVIQQHEGANEERDTDVNFPVMSGDRIVTGPDGSCEIQFDNGAIVWIWYDTRADITMKPDESETRKTIRLHVGEGAFRFRADDMGSRVEIGDVNLSPQGSALFRVLHNPDGSFRLEVLDGEVSVEGRNVRQSIKSGIASVFDGEQKQRSTETVVASSDVFGNWYEERDSLRNRQASENEYIPDDKEAALEDLDGHGKWVYNIYLGNWTWVPFVPVGWVPYHYGYWDWIAGWGWTWIPEEPWGWYPYHYGYWAFYFEFGWVWVPHWRWGPHWAAWRYDGRSVRWVAIHPQDHLAATGRLADGAIPRNSRLKLGTPVEKSIDASAFNASGIHLQRSDAKSVKPLWQNTPPAGIPSHRFEPVKGFNQPTQSSLNRPGFGFPNRSAKPSRDHGLSPAPMAPGSKPGHPAKQPQRPSSSNKPTEVRNPNQRTIEQEIPQKNSMHVPGIRYQKPTEGSVSKITSRTRSGFWPAMSKAIGKTAKSAGKTKVKMPKKVPFKL